MVNKEAFTREYVLEEARRQDVKFIRLWFSDILGRLKGFAIKAADLAVAMEHGVGFDGSAIEGFARSFENDMRAFPDPSTFSILPWRPRGKRGRQNVLRYPPPRRATFPGRPAPYPEDKP